jgi:hypothetical protein
MGYIIGALFLILGFLIGSFGVIQIIVVIRFSIPFTKELKLRNAIKDANSIIRSNMKTVYFWTVVIIASIVLIYNFASNASFIEYIIGIIISISMGFSGTGYTELNYKDYYTNYGHLIDMEIINSSDD